jgi:CDP-glucose 4,6-dehydratase
LAAKRDLTGDAFNFSNEQPISVADITNLILRLMDSSLEPEIRNEATNEIRCQYLSAAKARDALGWRPQFQLEEGLRLTIDWYRDFFRQKA